MAYPEIPPCQTEEGCPFSAYQIAEEVRTLRDPRGINDTYIPAFKERMQAAHIAECLRNNGELVDRDPDTPFFSMGTVDACPRVAVVQFKALDFAEQHPEILEADR